MTTTNGRSLAPLHTSSTSDVSNCRTLAQLNAGFVREHVSSDGCTLRREYRVGRWGLEIVNTPQGERPARGTWRGHLHLLTVDVLTSLPVDLDAAADCAERDPVRSRGLARASKRVEPNRLHGGVNHAPCFARRIGDVVAAWPHCRNMNVRRKAEFDPTYLDVDKVDCANCLRYLRRDG